MENLQIFICERSEDWWAGSLVIVATTEKRAVALFKEHEGKDDEPYAIRQEPMIEKEMVLYDDAMR